MKYLHVLVFSIFKYVKLQPTEETSTPFTPHHKSAFPCYNEMSQAQRCVPEFVNAAFNRRVESTNTCGEHRPVQYCVQSGHSGMIKDCDICDARVPTRGHSAVCLTDFNNPENETWWQSETMNENIQFPHMVNLTLNLGKAFDITYVRLKFHSPRPESFAIFKKSRSNDSWIPWQYYSATCRTTFGFADKAPILYNAETLAQCTSEYSDISPLTGADVAFSTLEGRPSAHDFENSPILQDWVTATEIRVVLNRLNTFGDEVFRDDKVLRSYYYAISDFAVGGRCKCNGHASECVKSTGQGVERLVCSCEHNTMGEDCDQCKADFNDRPWKPATADDANECKACDCNGLSTRCYFDEQLFQNTGSGGHCVDCAGSTTGAHCESCLDHYYRRTGERYCSACSCNEMGSLHLQCNDQGKCACKPGVTGQFCDRCWPGYYEFSTHGCKHCGCEEAGSLHNEPHCRPDTGVCSCKKYVEGKKCDRCIPGHFLLDKANEFGCTPCFCHGHASVCESAAGYYKTNWTSDFNRGSEAWKIQGPNGRPLEAQYNERDRNLAATDSGGPTYFVAPERFLGDQRNSYNQLLSFKLRVVDRNSRASVRDIILQGVGGKSISLPIFAQDNSPPDIYEQVYRYRLHDDTKFQWTPDLEPLDFMSILSNVTAIKIRATFAPGDVGFMDDFSLGSASLVPSSGSNGNGKALFVETCSCPEGFIGQHCESCGPGYRREPKFGGPFARCVKCRCHNHSELCDADSGRCICKDNTAGDACEKCSRGFYGDAFKGTPQDCQPCPCPNRGPCQLHSDAQVFCTECSPGYAGRLCDICADGYYGDGKNQTSCKLCECSGNIDQNSIGNCDRVSGECKKCVHNTQGFHCEKCSPGFFGDALLEPKGDCRKCSCSPAGTQKSSSNYKALECAQQTGQCECLPNVIGRACDRCAIGYFNISSALGCQPCACEPLGSVSSECHADTGHCQCKPGVLGKRCDQCEALHFGFSVQGCKACDCLPIGSLSPQCHLESGQCHCRSTVEGRRCDQCMENKYNLHAGCLDCEPCYSLVQQRVNRHRQQLQQLRQLLKDVLQNPTVVNDTNFEHKLTQVLKSVELLAGVVSTRMILETADTRNQMQYLSGVLNETGLIFEQIETALANSATLNEKTKHSLARWEQIRGDAEEKLKQADHYLHNEGKAAWEEASIAAESHGQQSRTLTSIAEEASKLASRHKNDSVKIEEFAQRALNSSKQAERGAEDAVFGGQATSQEINRLKNEFIAAQQLLNATQMMGKEQQERAETLHKDASVVLNKVATAKVPTVDIEKLAKAALDALEEAKEVRNQAETMAQENKPVVDRARKLVDEFFNQLSQALAFQQQADRILADVDLARSSAQSAVEMAQKTLRVADETLKTLETFDDLVARSKGDAIAAMNDVAAIQQLVTAAEQQTKVAEHALGGASDEAANALKIANEAKSVAEEASTDALHVKREAGEMKDTAENIVGEARKVQQETTDKTALMNNYQDTAKIGRQNTANFLGECSAAEIAAKKAHTTVTSAATQIQRVLDELNSVDAVSDGELDRLQALLQDANATLSPVAVELQQLKALRAEQDRKLNSLQTELQRAQVEVDNLEQIKNSLPANQCFNVVALEGSRR